MATTVRTQVGMVKAGATVIQHDFKFGVGAVGAVTAATLKQGGDGLVKSVARPGVGRYTITVTPPNVIEILTCLVTYNKAAQTDAEVFGHYKVGSLTAGSPGVPQTFEIFFATSAGAAAEVPSGGEVVVRVIEIPNKSLGARIDN